MVNFAEGDDPKEPIFKYIYEENEIRPSRTFVSFFYMRPIDIDRASEYNYPNQMIILDMLLRLVREHKEELKLKEELPSMDALENILKSLDTTRYSELDWEGLHSMNERIGFVTKGKIAKSSITRCLTQASKEILHIELESTTFEVIDSITDYAPLDIEIEASQKTLEELNAFCKAYNYEIEFVSNLSRKQELDFKRNLYIAVSLIEKSIFKKVVTYRKPIVTLMPYIPQHLFGRSGLGAKQGPTTVLGKLKFIGGTNIALRKNQKKITKGFSVEKKRPFLAIYDASKDHIEYAIYEEGTKLFREDNFVSLIHEFGHRYHTQLIRHGASNQEFHILYDRAIQGSDQDYLRQLPKIGDPFSDLRREWWGVRTNPASDYILTEIQGDVYCYTDSRGDTLLIDKKVLLQRITTPSTYGAKDYLEFFAEMFGLIVLGLVKPNQQTVANEFIHLVSSESI